MSLTLYSAPLLLMYKNMNLPVYWVYLDKSTALNTTVLPFLSFVSFVVCLFLKGVYLCLGVWIHNLNTVTSGFLLWLIIK